MPFKLLMLLLLLAPFAAQAVAANLPEKRQALVIGNARYASIPLDNPEHDARLVASTLRKLGFEVAEHLNLNVRDFRRVLREFTRRVQDEDGVAVLYYAGHGVQINGRNYLLPVDINLRDEEEIKDDSVDVDDVFVSRIERARTQVRIVILDACRDNPFRKTRQLRPMAGLAEMSARGTLIAYSSAPGAPAADGPPGSNSIYTRHLTSEMLVEGVEVEQMFKNVRVKVLRDSQERQVPWDNSSLTARFSFNPSRGIAREDASKQAEVSALRKRIEQMARDQRVAERRRPDAPTASPSLASSASSLSLAPVVLAPTPTVNTVNTVDMTPIAAKPKPVVASTPDSRRNEPQVLAVARRSIAPRPNGRCADMLVQFQLGGTTPTNECHSLKE